MGALSMIRSGAPMSRRRRAVSTLSTKSASVSMLLTLAKFRLLHRNCSFTGMPEPSGNHAEDQRNSERDQRSHKIRLGGHEKDDSETGETIRLYCSPQH